MSVLTKKGEKQEASLTAVIAFNTSWNDHDLFISVHKEAIALECSVKAP